MRAQRADEEAGKPRPGAEGQDSLSPGELLAERSAKGAPELAAPNTSVFSKSVYETDDAAEDIEGREVKVIKAQRGDTLARVLARLGAEPWQVRAMSDAARNALPDGALTPGQEMQVTLVPSVVRANRMEPIRFSVFGDGQEHKVTVTRNAAGEFVASGSPIDERIVRPELIDDDQRRPPASTPASTIPRPGRASRPTSSCRSSRSTPTRRTSASGCAPATRSSSSST